MALDTKHPKYLLSEDDWELMTDAYRGERQVKAAGTKYLPATPGQLLDGMDTNQKGWKNYAGYLTRAKFPDLVAQSVEAMLGIMHHKPANIELPPEMEELRERITIKGESLQMLLRKINEAQLVTGRLGLLADVQDDAVAGVLPYIAMYDAGAITNWDDGTGMNDRPSSLNLVVLDETDYRRKDVFDWEQVTRYRVLVVGDPQENEDYGVYQMGTFDADGSDSSTYNEASLITPSIAGNTLDHIPFVIINSKDVVSDPDDPPLLGLARLSMTIYRVEADYRQCLFMQGQDTLVIIGDLDDGETRAGAGAKISLPEGGDAKYIGVSSKGLTEVREALQNDQKEAAEMGGKLLDNRSGNAESGQALHIRVSARTASLHQIALAGAEGLQQLLRSMAIWVGADPEKVIITPNTDFADDEVTGQDAVQWMSAKSLGLPLSLRSVHTWLKEKDVTKMEFEEELSEIEKEKAAMDDEPDGTKEGGNEDE